MYRHLLVPVDDSALSDTNAAAAVRLAGSLGARVSFFRACAGSGSARSDARLRQADPAGFAESTFGDSHAMLARHAVLADDAGVDYELVSALGGSPAEAIVDAAQGLGCDLIVMASHGAHGMAALWHPSTTAAVLRRTTLPVLVSRVEANDPVRPREAVLASLQEEHQSIGAVARAMKQMADSAAASPGALDLLTLESMLKFLQAFAGEIHHAKEERLLHPCMLERIPDVAGVLQEVKAQHRRQQALVAQALDRLEPVMSDAGAPSAPLLETTHALCDAIRAHLALEEQILMPLAQRHFLDEDWASLAPAMPSHRMLGQEGIPAAETRRLFTRIAGLQAGTSVHRE